MSVREEQVTAEVTYSRWQHTIISGEEAQAEDRREQALKIRVTGAPDLDLGYPGLPKVIRPHRLDLRWVQLGSEWVLDRCDVTGSLLLKSGRPGAREMTQWYSRDPEAAPQWAQELVREHAPTPGDDGPAG